MGLLKRCARVWADGSHMGRDPSRGLSLATLTDWIWSRSLTIKQYCNTMCVPLFDYSGRQLGTAEQKRLSHCGVQLKWLSEIMDMVMTTCNQYIPEDILEQLKDQQKSIQIAAEYQEVLVWMFNMGLLPECNGTTILPLSSLNSSVTSAEEDVERRPVSMVYPYELLNNFYRQKREQFFEADRKYVKNSPTWNSCSMLYIDALIDRECGGVGLYRDWREDGGSGLYPPRSLQSMLRILLLPNVSIQSKYSIFMYLFMDLNVVYQDHECHALVQNLYKFPTAFKMGKDMIKLIESFWHLDHNNFEEAVVDLKASSMTKWQLELMVECLFLHQWPHLSLRALQMPGPSISPVIEMRVLLGNNLISEAFLFQKKHGDKSLLVEFFNSCYKLGSLRAILKLPLTETEGQLLGEFLLSVDASMPRNLHFVYLLQRSKYVEAVDLVENLRVKKGQQQQVDAGSVNAVLSTYKATMPPIYQEMSDIYRKTTGGAGGGGRGASQRPSINHSMDQSIRQTVATPLSSQLIRNKVDVNSSVYQMAITAVKEATNYSLFQSQQVNQSIKSPNKFTSIPFLRKPLQETMYEHETSTVIYPKLVEANAENKRKTVNDAERDEHLTKRRKLDDINTGLLTSFEPTKVDRMLEFGGSQRKTIPQAQTSALSTPIVKRVANAANCSPSGGKMTPHSILKARNIFRDSPGPEEKVLRFKQASVSPGIFDLSAIKKPQERRDSGAASGTQFDGPKPRRSIRSITPEDHILSSTRNQFEDVEEANSTGRKKLEVDFEEEMKRKMLQVAAEEEEIRRTAKAKDVSASRTYSPKRELRSQGQEKEAEGEEEERETEDDGQVAQKLPPIQSRRSLRSRTPEQVSPRGATSTRSATKKTLTRMVLESNAKRNLMEQRQEDIQEASVAMEEGADDTIGNNTTLDSTMPISEYSLNLDRDPLAADRTILADNSNVSDSLLGGWKERLQAGVDTTRESFISDASEVASMGDVLVDTPNQSLQFVNPEQVSMNKSLEEEMEDKMKEMDHLKEDTVYQPVVEEIQTEEEAEVEAGPKVAEEDVIPEQKEIATPEPLTPLPAVDDGQFKVPTPPKSIQGTSRIPFMFNQDTFVVSSPDDGNKDQKPEEEKEEEKATNLYDEDDSPEEDYYGEENSGSDLSGVSSKSEASNDDHKLLDDFPEGSNEEDEDLDDDFDDSDGYSDDSDEDAPPAKPFKTNEVIDLLDSDDDEEEKDNIKQPQGSSSDSNASDPEDLNDSDGDGEKEVQPEVEEYVPGYSVGQLQYGATFDVAPEESNEEVEVGEEVIQEPDFEEKQVDSPEQMDQENEAEYAGNIYDDMEVDVVGEEAEDGNSNGLNDALMLEEEESKDAEMCLRIDEDSQPPPAEMEAEDGGEGQTMVEDATVNELDKAVLLEETVEGEAADVVNEGEVKEPVAEVEVEEEKREEVVEVVPPPTVAYVTTEEEREDAVVELKEPAIEREPEVEKEQVSEVVKEQKPELEMEQPQPDEKEPEPINEPLPEPETVPEPEILEEPTASTSELNAPPSVDLPTTPEIKGNDPPAIERASNEKDQPEATQSQSTEKSNESPIASTQPSSSQQSDAAYPAESESSQPEKLTARRRSVRAVSQPRNSISDELLPAKIRTRRATAEAAEATAAGTPKRRNSHLFDQGGSEERVTPNLRMTPMRLARLTESTENLATGTPTRRTRATSIESDISAARTPTTRGTRRRSKAPEEEEDDNVSVTSNASRRSVRGRKAATTDTEADDAKSTVSSSSAGGKKGSTARAKKTLIDTAIPEEESEMQDYSTSRRLTRNQQQMMERSMKVQNRAMERSSSSISPGTSPAVEESAESDADSVSSKISRASQNRRSVRALSKEVNTGECAGVVEKRRRTEWTSGWELCAGLRQIVEEEEEDDEEGNGQVMEFEITLRFRVTSASQVQVRAVPEAQE